MRLVDFAIFVLAIANSSALQKQYPDSALLHSRENKRAEFLSFQHDVLTGKEESGEGKTRRTGAVRHIGIQDGSNTRSNANHPGESENLRDPKRSDAAGRILGLESVGKGAGQRTDAIKHDVPYNHSKIGSHVSQLQGADRVQRLRAKYDSKGRRRLKARPQKRRLMRRQNWRSRSSIPKTFAGADDLDRQGDIIPADETECSESTDDVECTESDPGQVQEAGRGIMKRKHKKGRKHRQADRNRKCKPGTKLSARKKCLRRLRRKCSLGKGGKCLRRSVTRKSEKVSLQKHDRGTDGGKKEGLEDDERTKYEYGVKPDSNTSDRTHSSYPATDQPKKQKKRNKRSHSIKRSYGRGIFSAPRKFGRGGQGTVNDHVELRNPSNIESNARHMLVASRLVHRRRKHRCRPSRNRKCRRRRRRRRRLLLKRRKNQPNLLKSVDPSDLEGSTEEDYGSDESMEEEEEDEIVNDRPQASAPHPPDMHPSEMQQLLNKHGSQTKPSYGNANKLLARQKKFDEVTAEGIKGAD